MANRNEGGLEALHRLKATDPPLWLTQNPELSQASRTASQYLFSSLKPFCPKSPFDRLLVEGFDAEQIWQQIELQTQPLVGSLRRELKRYEKNPLEISKLFGKKKKGEVKSEDLVKENGGFEEESGEEDDLEGMEDGEDGGFDDEEDEEEEEDEDEEEEEERAGGGDGGIEDKFLKIKELEEYLQDDEDREYGGGLKKGKHVEDENEEEEDGDEDDEEEEDEDDELGGFDDDGEDEEDKLESARYEDFFGGKKKKGSKRESKPFNGSENLDTDDELEYDEGFDDQKKKETLSTHEKLLAKKRSEIEELEKANLEPKSWTMQGEVTAAKRPPNSALEVDLDFEHNVRPVPVITEEVTASLEEIIKKRILEGHFDDVQKAPNLPSKAPREIKELDENKSKKGLAEIYEEDYAKTTGLASAPLSFSDEQKKEASMLFKKLCLKLDALSHFHFTPKPVIEDMTIQTNVPALAMEEIAPVAVSDAAMLAPEEVFAGKGDIKEEAELTQEERKRRRANKKRKFKAETTRRVEKKARDSK